MTTEAAMKTDLQFGKTKI